MRIVSTILAVALLAIVPACGGDSAGAGDDTTAPADSALALEACEHADHSTTPLTPATDPSDLGATPIVAGSGPVKVTLIAGGSNYVLVATSEEHSDAGLFLDRAGVVKAFKQADTGGLYSLVDEGAPACGGGIAASYLLHLHMPVTYQIELDGDAGGEVWLDFVAGDSDHSSHGDDADVHDHDAHDHDASDLEDGHDHADMVEADGHGHDTGEGHHH